MTWLVYNFLVQQWQAYQAAGPAAGTTEGLLINRALMLLSKILPWVGEKSIGAENHDFLPVRQSAAALLAVLVFFVVGGGGVIVKNIHSLPIWTKREFSSPCRLLASHYCTDCFHYVTTPGDGTAEQCKGGEERGVGLLGGDVLAKTVGGAFSKVAGEPPKYRH